MDKNYYIYRWIRLDTNTPFHVGKGTKNRYKNTTQRNEYFKRIFNKVPCEVEIMIYDLTEEQAFKKEIEIIKLYKSLGYCETNLTTGGTGSSGVKRSKETKELLGRTWRGKKRPPFSQEWKDNIGKAFKGKVLTAEHKQKTSETMKAKGSSWFTPEHKRKISEAKKEYYAKKREEAEKKEN